MGSRVALTFSGVVASASPRAPTASARHRALLQPADERPAVPAPGRRRGRHVRHHQPVRPRDDARGPRPPATRVGKTLASAGASILVTSATDVFAFLVGSNTSLPALRNFCFYASFGILFIFFFQVTWFVAFLVLDERRRASSQPRLSSASPSPRTRRAAVPRARPRRTSAPAWGEVWRGPRRAARQAVGQGRRVRRVRRHRRGGFHRLQQARDRRRRQRLHPGGFVRQGLDCRHQYVCCQARAPSPCTRGDVDVSSADGAALALAASLAFKADPYVASSSVELLDRGVQREPGRRRGVRERGPVMRS